MNLSKQMRLYVIGDIHGRLDLLERLNASAHQDAGRVGVDSLTITLGDYIDRGPDSRGMIEYLADNPFPGQYIPLKGNHEAVLMAFLDDPDIFNHWRHLGGLETLHSYGVPVMDMMRGRNFEKGAEQLRAALPEKHWQFLNALKLSLTVGRYFFCHAGVRPGIALDQQSENDLLWIRDEFLESKVNFGKIVVHGHTPKMEPQMLDNRINIDTGAFATGRLTCLVIENETYRFIAT